MTIVVNGGKSIESLLYIFNSLLAGLLFMLLSAAQQFSKLTLKKKIQ